MIEFYSYSRDISHNTVLKEYCSVHKYHITESFNDFHLNNESPGFIKMINRLRERDKKSRPHVIMKDITTLSRDVDSIKSNLDRILDLGVVILFIDYPNIDARFVKGYNEIQSLISDILEEISIPCCSYLSTGSYIPYGKKIDREVSSPLKGKIYLMDDPEETSIIGLIGMSALGYTNTSLESAFKIHEYLFYHKHSDKSIYDPCVTGKILKRGNAFLLRALNHYGFFNRGKKWTPSAIKDIIDGNVSLRETYWRKYIESNLIKI